MIAPLTLIDTFSRVVDDGWGTSDGGQVWTASGSNYDVAGAGVIYCPANAARIFPHIDLAAHNIAKQSSAEVLTRVRFTSAAAWPLTDFGPTLSYNNNSGYYLALQGNYSEIAIGCFINGSRYEIGRKAFSLQKNTYYWVRFRQTIANALQAKVWADGTPEPTSWTLTTSLWTSGNPPSAGSGGMFRVGTRDTYNINVDTWYYYTLEDAETVGEVEDNFNRLTSGTLGISTSKHVWQGTTSDDPEYTSGTRRGYCDGLTACFNMVDTSAYVNFLGPARTGNVEGTMEGRFGTASSGTAKMGLILRGTRGKVSGAPALTQGYVLYFDTGNNLTIAKRTNPTTITDLATASIPAIAVGTKFNMRFQIIDTTLQARCWEVDTEEPVTWQVSATDAAITSGSLGFTIEQSAAVSRFVIVDNIKQGLPSLLNTNAINTGNVLIASTTTGLIVNAQYSNDDNNTSTASLRYKPTTATSWSSIPTPSWVDRELKFFAFDLPNLTPASTYHVEVTYQDVDGVQGANPRLVVGETSSAALRTKSLAIVGSTPTSISLEAKYELDNDADATAIIEARTISTTLDVVEDYFVDERDGTYLQNADSVFGGNYIRHPATSNAVQSVRKGMYYYSNALSANNVMLYRHTSAPPIAEYTVKGTFLAEAAMGRVGLAARLHETSNTYYGCGVNATNNTWELFKYVSGTRTILASTPYNGTTNVVYTMELVVKDAYKAFVLDGVEILRTTDNTITETNYAGYYATNIASGTSTNQFKLGSFVVSYHTSTGSWVSYGAMTKDIPNKKFTKTISPLISDVIYEIRVTFTDGDGVAGANPLMVTTQIMGESSSLVLMGSSTTDTSTVISIFYQGDSNNNAYVEMQYRSLMDQMWNTVSFSKFRTDRVNKRFDVTLSGLEPSTSYNVKLNLIDPNGISQGGVGSLSAVFSTKGSSDTQTRQQKHYLWKVYDKDDVYLGTIKDAPEPEFSILENGGVTDLTFTISRKMSEIQAHKIIDFQNRIDIWAVDPSSQGMGPNMIDDPDCDPLVGAWVFNSGFGQNASYSLTGGPDGSSSLMILQNDSTQYETSSRPIEVTEEIPLFFSCIARARGAKLRMYVRSYDINDQPIDTSDFTETVGVDWQRISIEYIPPASTAYVRVLLRNTGKGTMWADKFVVLPKEMMVYRGRIETFTPKITEDGEEVSLDVLGIASLLSDDYIEFLQFVETQPQKDVEANRINYGAKDPADMLKKVVDELKRVNPFFKLYYTTESIRYTGNLMQYTFRDQQGRACFDKIRSLCPSGWHYAIEPDGLVVLRGPASAPTHTLHIGREIQTFEVEKSIRNLKNYVRVKGRQDEDESEPDGFGSINYIAFDQASIDKYGKRTLFIRDSQLTDPDSAKIVGDGRLDEVNREEQRATITIPDEKGWYVQQGPLRGYNIESFRAGDNVIIVDPIAGARNTYWNQFRWDEDVWDSSNVFMPLPESVPIKSVKYRGDHVELELSERPPSAVGDFSKFYRWLSNKDRED